jgi:hypothetical protein
MWCEASSQRSDAGDGGSIRAAAAQSSLPGLTPQVGFTRLAAHYTAQLGRARVAVQSILFAKKFLRRGWTRGSSPRVTEDLRRALPLTRHRVRGLVTAQAQTNTLYAEECDPGAAAESSARNGSTALMVASGNSSCTASLPCGSRAVRMPPTAASASISARDFGGVSAP